MDANDHCAGTALGRKHTVRASGVIRPNGLVVRAYLFRGVLLWIAARAAITVALMLAGEDPIRISGFTGVGIVLLVVVLGWIETRRRREGALLANLGVSPLLPSVCFAAPALLAELLLRFGATLFA